MKSSATQAKVEPWLRELTKRGSGRCARLRKCTNCQAPILVGLDEDVCAFVARVNPWPLDAIGEMLAVLASTRTYELRARSSGVALTYRGARAIRGRPAGGPVVWGVRFDVLAEHDCTAAVLPKTPSRLKPNTRKASSDVCPF